jgi:hypothetical protein
MCSFRHRIAVRCVGLVDEMLWEPKSDEIKVLLYIGISTAYVGNMVPNFSPP